MQLGAALRKVRKLRNYKLSDVSDRTGLSISFLSDIERGATKPSLDTLEKLAACYQVTVNELLKDVDFGTVATEKLEPPGFREFQEFIKSTGDELDESMYELLLQVEYRSRRSAKTKEDWLQRYYQLKSMLGR